MAAGGGMSRIADFESGHDCWFPVPVVTGSANVMINLLPAVKVGDVTSIHTCGTKPPHPDKCVKGSLTVFVNKKNSMRIGDLLSGGAVMAQGSHSVIAGG
jgi:uncharacterized Zn-binding protein involved in type VI secretion